jgi:hypothetical protein
MRPQAVGARWRGSGGVAAAIASPSGLKRELERELKDFRRSPVPSAGSLESRLDLNGTEKGSICFATGL